ncbi:30S ribosomal protein S20 [Candidatus Wolfebacteria bacterium RIFCSPLOWO2_01_FULL_38_11]|uniref:Small ribosomal subunit protein bS20 n=2 Tax=Candidatus Wolfeibacteriota TaxID=1752735 RepID=A0A0G0G059_9BACT|nr:MAG: 30S ribosomal protein S20 [Candidatus Wolfebacteria bacterium GW2011_GWC1_37_10]OGM90378.1 MAG: 30S ribosomal protein S20 [Candidatus Wolfebacteria bacterium RIFCSPLOWO2_01_FULL_38_11]
MPITKSAKKALRQSVRKRKKNLKRKSELKSVIKKYKGLIIEGKKEDAAKYLSQVYKKLDKFAKVNLIKNNKASRTKSRLSKLLAK